MKKILFDTAMKWFSLLLILTILLSCEKNQSPTCTIVYPEDDTEIEIGETVIISVIPDDSDGNITEVRFFVNDIGLGSASSYPYKYPWNTSDVEMGSHTISATVKDNNGASAKDEIVVLIIEERIIGPVTDVDGNVYQTVKIGTQWWMAENLKTTHYADGTAVPLVESSSAWDSLGFTDKAYCWNYNSDKNMDIYGGLYTWAAAMNGAASSHSFPSGVQGVCPDGWHLPSDYEWQKLEMFLGMSLAEAEKKGWRGTDEGGKLKEPYSVHWTSPNTGATNESGFTARPGGYRNSNGGFHYVGFNGQWWSSSEYNSSQVWYRHLNSGDTRVARYYDGKDGGFSVRCVKD